MRAALRCAERPIRGFLYESRLDVMSAEQVHAHDVGLHSCRLPRVMPTALVRLTRLDSMSAEQRAEFVGDDPEVWSSDRSSLRVRKLQVAMMPMRMLMLVVLIVLVVLLSCCCCCCCCYRC